MAMLSTHPRMAHSQIAPKQLKQANFPSVGDHVIQGVSQACAISTGLIRCEIKFAVIAD
jgi:molybdopterin-biosynthesis enzyme MoeA-like protein